MHRPSVKYIRITNDIPPAYVVLYYREIHDRSFA